MSTEGHLEEWRTVKAAALKGLKVKAFALVTVQEDGTVHYGADFSLEPRAKQEIEKWLKVMASNCADTRKKFATQA